MNQIHRQSTDAASIRPCSAADMPAVAALFQKHFRDARKPVPASLSDYFASLYLDTPYADPEIVPLVFRGARGSVDGFIGVLPLAMTIGGRSMRAAVAGTLVVDKPEENPLAGARLLRAFFSGPQDISITESANPISQAMWERLGAPVVPGYSLEWLRVLRPAGFAVAVAAEKADAARVLAVPGRGLDSLLAHGGLNRFAPDSAPRRGPDGADADEETFLAAYNVLSEDYALRPG